MRLREFCNVRYEKHIQHRDPTLNEWRQRVRLSTFYVCTRNMYLDKDIPENADVIRMNSANYEVQLELFINYPKILVRRAPDKNEILESMEDLVWLSYWISKDY